MEDGAVQAQDETKGKPKPPVVDSPTKTNQRADRALQNKEVEKDEEE